MLVLPRVIEKIIYKEYLITIKTLPELLLCKNKINGYISLSNTFGHSFLGGHTSKNVIEPIDALEDCENWINDRVNGVRNIFWSSSDKECDRYIIRSGYLIDDEEFTRYDGLRVRFGAEIYFENMLLKKFKSWALWDAENKATEWIEIKKEVPVHDWLKG